jgi:hypothetical protein
VDVRKLSKEQIEAAWASETGLNGVRSAPTEDEDLRRAIADFVGKKISDAENLKWKGEERAIWHNNFKKKRSLVLYVLDGNGDFTAGAVCTKEAKDTGSPWLYIQGLAANGGGGAIVQQLKALVKADPNLYWMGADAVRGSAYEYWTLAMSFQPLESVRRRICEICFEGAKGKVDPFVQMMVKKDPQMFCEHFYWDKQGGKYLQVAWYPFYGSA